MNVSRYAKYCAGYAAKASVQYGPYRTKANWPSSSNSTPFCVNRARYR